MSCSHTRVRAVHRVGEIKDFMEIGRSAGEEIRKEAGEQFFADLMEYVQDIQAANTKPTKQTTAK